MEKNHERCLGDNEAFLYYQSHNEWPLYIPDYIESEIKRLKHSEHSENYIKERIRIYKYLYCEHADSEKLRRYSRDSSLRESDKVPDDVKNEVRQIIKEAEDLLDKTRDIDKYHLGGTHWQENQNILEDFKDYLSAVYGIPTAIMITLPKKPF